MTELRAARALDAGAVGAILSEFVDATPWLPRIHSRAEDLAHAARMIDLGWVTLADQGGKIVGFLGRNIADLNALYVTSDARDDGVGSALIRNAQAQSATLKLWTFQANESAQRFYRRHGFCETQRTDGAGSDEGLPDIHFAWNRKGD